jgi:hypothetical protein
MPFLRPMAVFAAFSLVLTVSSGCARKGQAKPASEKQARPKAAPPAEKKRVTAKAIYLTGWTAGYKPRFEKLLKLVDDTELNAMVIDVKDVDGVLTYKSDLPIVQQAGANARQKVPDFPKLMERLKKHNVYTIARIVCFKDETMPKRMPELAVQRKGGGIWKDRHGRPWANPYNQKAWDYIVAIAREAADKGFDEIQLDYIRFPTDGPLQLCVYPGKTGEPEWAVTKRFMAYFKQKLADKPVWIGADLFGLVASVKHDMGIGQRAHSLAVNADYICPMVYPSHYARGEFGMRNPNARPYRTVYLSLRDFLKQVEGTGAKVRPWLQDFTLGPPRYGAAEVRAQIKAARDLGIDQYMLWNAGCRYTRAAFRLEKPSAKMAGGGAGSRAETQKPAAKPAPGPTPAAG